jgi:hypothetical protein
MNYEQDLFQDNWEPTSSRFTQMFEHLFFHFLKQSFYTTRNYKADYLEQFKGLKLIDKPREVTYFWGEFSDKHKELNSKKTSTQFAINNNLCHSSTRIEKKGYLLKAGELARPFDSYSGKGVLKFGSLPKEMIVEKQLKRLYDFSTLFLNERESFTYANLVDGTFKYKGTLIGPKFKNSFAELVKGHYQKLGVTYPFCIDSFVYEEGGDQKTYALCEVNVRKTMGWVANELKQKFAPGAEYFFFFFSNQKVHNDKLTCLSPDDNFFHTYIVWADSISELESSLGSGFSSFFMHF